MSTLRFTVEVSVDAILRIPRRTMLHGMLNPDFGDSFPDEVDIRGFDYRLPIVLKHIVEDTVTYDLLAALMYPKLWNDLSLFCIDVDDLKREYRLFQVGYGAGAIDDEVDTLEMPSRLHLVDIDGNTILMRLLKNHWPTHIPLFEKIIAMGPDNIGLDLKNNAGMTPAMLAMFLKHPYGSHNPYWVAFEPLIKVEHLVSDDFNIIMTMPRKNLPYLKNFISPKLINWAHPDKGTPIMQLIFNYDYTLPELEHICLKAIDMSQDTLNFVNSKGNTALIYALKCPGSSKIIVKLLKLGPELCNSNVVNEKGETAFIIASQMNMKFPIYSHYIRRMLSWGPEACALSHIDKTGATAFYYLLLNYQSIEIINIMLDFGPDACGMRYSEELPSPLYLACKNNIPEAAIMKMMEFGPEYCRPNYRTETGYTALIWAINHKYYGVINRLLDWGPDTCGLNSILCGRGTALIKMCENGKECTNEILKALDYGPIACNARIQNYEGYTALMFAIERCSTRVINRFLDFPPEDIGLNLTTTRGRQVTPLMLCIIVPDASKKSTLRKYEDIALRMLCHGPDATAAGHMYSGTTALALACEKQMFRVANALLDFGYEHAGITGVSYNGATPLMSACRYREVDICRRLLARPVVELGLGRCYPGVGDILTYAKRHWPGDKYLPINDEMKTIFDRIEAIMAELFGSSSESDDLASECTDSE